MVVFKLPYFPENDGDFKIFTKKVEDFTRFIIALWSTKNVNFLTPNCLISYMLKAADLFISMNYFLVETKR